MKTEPTQPEVEMMFAMRSSARVLLVVAATTGLLLLQATFAAAQEDLYPPPEEVPATEPAVTAVVTDVVERPVTEVLPGDLARTGFDITGPLALGAMLVLVGGAVLAADRWYVRRQERALAG